MREGQEQLKIICAGRLYCDLIFTGMPRLPSHGTEVFANGFAVHPGGGAYITAANLAQLGSDVALASMLPNAPFIEAILPEMTAASVNLDLCQALPHNSGPQITAALVQEGDRAFVSHRSGPALPDLTEEKLANSQATHLHIGELATLIEHPELIILARNAGLTVSLDCSWDDAITAAQIGDLIGQVDVFLPNELEVNRLLELGLKTPFAPVTVAKLGAKGAVLQADGEQIAVPAEPLSALDTTGAGDAFNAGFLSAWLRQEAPGRCVEMGNMQARREILRRGGKPATSGPGNTQPMTQKKALLG